MPDNMTNKLNAQVGFTIVDGVPEISKITKELTKINTVSKGLGKSLDSAEKSIIKFAQMFSNTNGKIVINTKETAKIQLEQERRITAEKKSQLRIQEQDHKSHLLHIANEEKKALSDYRTNNSIRLNSYKELLRQQRVQYNKHLSEIQALESKNVSKGKSSASSSLSGRLSSAMIRFTGLSMVLDEFQDISSEVVAIEKNAINIQRIMGTTSEKTRNDLVNMAIDTARHTATQITDVQEIQSSWIRINDLYADNLQLLDKISTATAKFVNVAEIADAEEAVTLLNATMLQFNMTVEEGIETLDKWAYMADKTALGTADEFGESLSSIGGYITALGGDVDDAIVLTSILGDRLAKTGSEAGKALKTVLAYSTRDKTLGLFKDLGLDTDEFNNKLLKTENNFEEFDVIMQTLSGAYNQAMAEGNEMVAKAIQNAIGATRTGDSAIALLKNWAEDSKKYYGMIEESASMNYLDEQNKALLESLSAQWQVLQTDITEAAYAIANMGLIDFVKDAMVVLGDLFNSISNANPTVVQFVETSLLLVSAMAGIKQVAKLSGYYDVYATAVKHGTKAQREHATAVYQSAQAEMMAQEEKLKSILATRQWTQEEEANYILLAQKKLTLDSLSTAYTNGTINAEQYANAIKHVTHASTAENVEQAKSVALGTANATSKGAQTLATKALTWAQNQLNGVMAIGNALMKALPHMLLFSAVSGLISLFTNLASSVEKSNEQFKDAVSAHEEASSALKTANDELETAKTRMQELESMGTLTFVEQQELDNLKETVRQLQIAKDVAEKLERKTVQGVVDSAKSALRDTTSDAGKAYSYFTNLGNTEYTSTFADPTNVDYASTISALNSYADAVLQTADAQGKLTAENQVFFNNLMFTIRELYNLSDPATWNTMEFDNIINSDDIEYTTEQLVAMVHAGELTPETLAGYGKLNELVQNADFLLEDGETKAEAFVRQLSTIDPTLSAIDITTIDQFRDALNGSVKDLETIDSDISKVLGGGLTASDLLSLSEQYEGFYEVMNAGTQAQVEWLKKYKLEKQDAFRTDLQEKENELLNQRSQLLERIAYLEGLSPTAEITAQLMESRENLELVNESLAELASYNGLQVSVDINGVVEGLHNIVSAIDNLVSAQNKLAQGTALTKQELFNLVQAYPELIYQSDIFNTATVDGQQKAINAIIAMKEQQYDAEIDTQIAELKAKIQSNNDIIKSEREKKNTLQRISIENVKKQDGYQKRITQLMAEYNGMQSKNAVDIQSAGYTDSLNVTDIWLSQWSGGILGRMNAVYQSIANGLKNALGGKAIPLSGAGGLTSSKVVQGTKNNIANATKGSLFNSAFNGSNIDSWVQSELSKVNSNIDALLKENQGYKNAINNLESLKGLSLTSVSNTYGGNASSGTSSSSSSSTSSVLSDFENQVEDLQSRLVKALKAKYTELYELREKQLEAERDAQIAIHNERIAKLQEEIDKLNGNTPEDKQANLQALKASYEAWSEDDSSLGRSKQKELADQITDLEKEIAIDNLEEQIEKEEQAIDNINDKFDQLLDKDSPLYDPELKRLSQLMTQQSLYEQANALIANNKQQEIIDLLAKYDADYSGVATLMGQTAGQIIAEQVASALSAYKTLKTGSTGSSSGGGSTGGGSSSSVKGTHTVQPKDTLWKIAQQWYGNGAQWAKIQNANNIDPNNLRVGQQLVIPFDTGGYTGNNEGIAYLHKKEYVLNATQTEAFRNLVFDFLPRLDSNLRSLDKASKINQNINFNKELMKVDIGTVINNTEYDMQNQQDNLNRMFVKTLQSAGINIKK